MDKTRAYAVAGLADLDQDHAKARDAVQGMKKKTFSYLDAKYRLATLRTMVQSMEWELEHWDDD
jgi:hypothetical protein